MSSSNFLRSVLCASCLATASTAQAADWTGKIICNEAKNTTRRDIVGEAFSAPINMRIVGDAVTLDRVWSRGVARATGKNFSGQAMLEGFGWRNGQSEAAFSAKATMIQEGTSWTGSVRYAAISGKWYQDCTVNLVQRPIVPPVVMSRDEDNSKPRSSIEQVSTSPLAAAPTTAEHAPTVVLPNVKSRVDGEISQTNTRKSPSEPTKPEFRTPQGFQRAEPAPSPDVEASAQQPLQQPPRTDDAASSSTGVVYSATASDGPRNQSLLAQAVGPPKSPSVRPNVDSRTSHESVALNSTLSTESTSSFADGPKASSEFTSTNSWLEKRNSFKQAALDVSGSVRSLIIMATGAILMLVIYCAARMLHQGHYLQHQTDSLTISPTGIRLALQFLLGGAALALGMWWLNLQFIAVFVIFAACASALLALVYEAHKVGTVTIFWTTGDAGLALVGPMLAIGTEIALLFYQESQKIVWLPYAILLLWVLPLSFSMAISARTNESLAATIVSIVVKMSSQIVFYFVGAAILAFSAAKPSQASDESAEAHERRVARHEAASTAATLVGVGGYMIFAHIFSRHGSNTAAELPYPMTGAKLLVVLVSTVVYLAVIVSLWWSITLPYPSASP